MKYILIGTLSLFVIFLSGCNPVSPAVQEANLSTVAQLEQEVEKALSACDDKTQKEYKGRIETQRKKLNEAKFKTYLAKVKKLITCS